MQEWKPRSSYSLIEEFMWFEEGKKFAYRYLGGLEVYDFETNLKYRWAAGEYDHCAGSGRKVFVLDGEGGRLLGGVEEDQKVRFWKYPRM